jgi:hypothetical protein
MLSIRMYPAILILLLAGSSAYGAENQSRPTTPPPAEPVTADTLTAVPPTPNSDEQEPDSGPDNAFAVVQNVEWLLS